MNSTDTTTGTSGTPDDRGTDETTALDLIEEQAEANIRRDWQDGCWFFSVIDVIGLLTDAPKPRQYWFDMKRRIQDEGFRELSAKCRQLKLPSADGKYYRTDAADTETLLRIIQSIPSPKAEPVKQWLARVGAKRLDEVTHPLSASEASTTIVTVPKPAESAPALEWAHYYEQLASLYRRAAAYEAQLAYVDAKLDEHDAEITKLHSRLEDVEDELHSRLEGMEEVTRLVPEILERLGPQTLTSEHQSTVKNMARRLSELSGISYASIYAELNDTFHVGKYSDIADARWADITAWFQLRIDAAEKRRHS